MIHKFVIASMSEAILGLPRWPVGLLAIAILLLAPAPARAQDITTGLVGHWTLDETSGTTAADSTGNGNTGTLWGSMDAAADTSAGKIGSSFDFDATDDYITMGSPALLDDMNTKTLSAWIFPRSSGENQGGRIFYKRGGGSDGWQFNLIESSGDIALNYSHGFTGGGGGWRTAYGLIIPNQWNFVAVSYDRTSTGNDPVFYINGTLVSTTETTAPVTAAYSDASHNFQIGGQSNGFNIFDGFIDDTRIYSRILTAADVAALYRARAPGTIKYNADFRVPEYFDSTEWLAMGPQKPSNKGLVGWWKLDDTSLGSAVDSSGLGNNGTTSGGLAYLAAGKIGPAMDFDGVDDNVDIGDPASGILDFDATQSFSYSIWIKSTDTNALAFSKGDSGTGYDIIAGEGGTAGQHTCRISDGVDDVMGTQTQWANDSNWHHITCVVDRATQQLRTYGDGVLLGSVSASSIGSVATAIELRIGMRGAGNTPCDCDLDDARIYNRALSAGEISDLYEQGEPPGTWQQVGNDLNISGINNPALTALDGETVAFIDEGNDDLRTYSFDGTNWSQVGSDLNITGVSEPASIAALNGNTIAYIDGGNDDLRTYTFDGTNWSQVGNDLNITGCSWPGITKLTGNTIAYYDWSNRDLRTYTFDGTNWSQVGNDLNITGMNVAYPAALNPNTVVLSGTGGLRTYRWNGSDWAETGNRLSVPVGNAHPTLLHDNIIALWRHWAIQSIRNLEAWRWDGTNWLPYSSSLYFTGGAGIGDVTALNSSTIAFIDANNNDLRTYRLDQCTAPTRREGVIVYNADEDVMQYCDGEDWIAMGPVPGAGGAGCNNPSGTEGQLLYASDHRYMQYCDGSDWIQIGGRASTIPTAGLVLHWPLDETSGNTIADASGNGNTGTWSESGTDDVSAESGAGMVGTSIDFGTSKYVEAASFVMPDEGTFSAWLTSDFPEFNNPAANFPILFWAQTPTISVLYSTTSEYYGITTNGTFWRATYAPPADITTWFMLTATWSTSGTQLYLNGVPVGTGGSGDHSSNSPTGFFLGTRNALDREWDGRIDDVRIYNRALSASEISDLYYATGGN